MIFQSQCFEKYRYMLNSDSENYTTLPMNIDIEKFKEQKYQR